MPIYEFECTECKSEFELLVRSSEVPACPKCDSKRLEKLLSVPATPAISSSQLPMCQSAPLPSCGSGGCGGGQCQFD